MNEDTRKYYTELAENFINLTLDYNTLERVLQDIKEITKSRCKSETKINKIKKIFEELENEESRREEKEND